MATKMSSYDRDEIHPDPQLISILNREPDPAIQVYESADPDPKKLFADPEHCRNSLKQKFESESVRRKS